MIKSKNSSILILEEEDFNKPNLLKGHHVEKLYIPISKLGDTKILNQILPLISIEGVFFGSVIYYTENQKDNIKLKECNMSLYNILSAIAEKMHKAGIIFYNTPFGKITLEI